jgi:hypothetical protein
MITNKYLLGCVLLAGVAAASQFWLKSTAHSQSATQAPFSQPAKPVDRSYYYRLNVKLTHKDEHFNMNIVVQCYGDKLIPNETAPAGRWPQFYVERTKNNHAIGVRTTLGCDGHTTANGGAPADLLPSVYWYPDADDMTFAIMYATEDAYDNPLSQLKFLGATMHTATAAEHTAFVDEANAAGPKKLVFVIGGATERQDASSLVDVDEIIAKDGRAPKPNWSTTQNCYGIQRLKLSEAARIALREHWPAHKPKYWAPNGKALRAAMDDLLWAKPDETGKRALRAPLASGKFIKDYFWRMHEHDTDGLPTRKQGGRLLRFRGKDRIPSPEPYPLPPPELYPVLHSGAFGFYKSADRDSASLRSRVDRQGGGTKGFAYCQTRLKHAFNYKTKSVGAKPAFLPVFAPDPGGRVGRLRSRGRVETPVASDVKPVASEKPVYWDPVEKLLPNYDIRTVDEFVDDEKIERTPPEIGFMHLSPFGYQFFENDEYVLIQVQYQ